MIILMLFGALRALQSNFARSLAVAVSLGAAFVVTATTTPASRPAQPVDVAMAGPGLVADEHAAVADYLLGQTKARQAAEAAADRDWARQRALAAAETGRQVARAATGAKPTRVAHAVAPPKPAPSAAASAAPPLDLHVAAAPSGPAPAPRHRPVIEGVRTAIATVGRIPRWVTAGVQQAADWVVDGPVDTIVRWPERRLL